MKLLSLGISAILGGSMLFGAEKPHFEPVNPFDRDDYLSVVREQLVGKDEFYWMIVLPSFIPERAVILKIGQNADAQKQSPVVVIATPEKPIFGYEDTPDGGSRVRYDMHAEIHRISKPLTREDVDILSKATFAALQNTRYPRDSRQGLDGDTFIFCFDRLAGRTWSPDAGQPMQLVAAWSALGEYVRATSLADEQAALLRFRSACSDIQKEGRTRR